MSSNLKGQIYAILMNVTKNLAKFLERSLQIRDGESFETLVIKKLGPETRRKAREDNVKVLCDLDLAALLSVMSGNWPQIVRAEDLGPNEWDTVYAMNKVRNAFAHPRAEVNEDPNVLRQHLDTIESFCMIIKCLDKIKPFLTSVRDELNRTSQGTTADSHPQDSKAKSGGRETRMSDPLLSGPDPKEFIIDFGRRLASLTSNFTGRVDILSRVCQLIVDTEKKSVLIFGPPGIGKSSLSASIFKRLVDNYSKEVIPAVHHIQARDFATTDVASLFRSLVAQFLEELDLRAGFPMGDIAQILQVLKAIVKKKSNDDDNRILVVVVDGADELPVETQVTLRDILENLMNAGAKFILTTRRIKAFDGYSADFELCYDDDQNLEDVRFNTEFSISTLNLTEEQEQKVMEIVSKKVGGQFIYQSIILDVLRKGKCSVEDLNDLPDDMYQYYKMTLDKLLKKFESEAQYVEHGVPVLAALVLAKEPVTFDFLTGCVRSDCRFVRLVLNHLGEILFCTENNGETRYSFCHQSVAEFMRENDYMVADMPRVERLIASYLTTVPETEYCLKYALHHISREGTVKDLRQLLGRTSYTQNRIHGSFSSDPDRRRYDQDQRVWPWLPQ